MGGIVMANVLFKRVEDSTQLDNIPVVDGSFYVTGDGKSFIDYGGERLPVGGTPDTEMSDRSRNTVENNVIKQYVDDKVLGVYSTTETKIGKWINEKPIYRTVVYLSSLPNITYQIYNHNIADIDEYINVYGMATRPRDGFSTSLGSVRVDGMDRAIDLRIENKTQYRITTGMDRSDMYAYIIFEYTKTTD
jgi:hypothetical protein